MASSERTDLAYPRHTPHLKRYMPHTYWLHCLPYTRPTPPLPWRFSPHAPCRPGGGEGAPGLPCPHLTVPPHAATHRTQLPQRAALCPHIHGCRAPRFYLCPTHFCPACRLPWIYMYTLPGATTFVALHAHHMISPGRSLLRTAPAYCSGLQFIQVYTHTHFLCVWFVVASGLVPAHCLLRVTPQRL